MRVVLLTDRAGERHVQLAGSEIEVSPREAAALLASGQAEPAPPPAPTPPAPTPPRAAPPRKARRP